MAAGVGSLPAEQIVEIPSLHCNDLGGFGSFVCTLGKHNTVRLKGGNTYWVSVQARIDIAGGDGEWGWENQTTSEG